MFSFLACSPRTALAIQVSRGTQWGRGGAQRDRRNGSELQRAEGGPGVGGTGESPEDQGEEGREAEGGRESGMGV